MSSMKKLVEQYSTNVSFSSTIVEYSIIPHFLLAKGISSGHLFFWGILIVTTGLCDLSCKQNFTDSVEALKIFVVIT